MDAKVLGQGSRSADRDPDPILRAGGGWTCRRVKSSRSKTRDQTTKRRARGFSSSFPFFLDLTQQRSRLLGQDKTTTKKKRRPGMRPGHQERTKQKQNVSRSEHKRVKVPQVAGCELPGQPPATDATDATEGVQLGSMSGMDGKETSSSSSLPRYGAG